MTAKPIPIPMFGDFIGSWHTWFAWYPIMTYDGRFVWLKYVWRRGVYRHQYLSGGSDFWFWYALEAPNNGEIE